MAPGGTVLFVGEDPLVLATIVEILELEDYASRSTNCCESWYAASNW
jgi:hypothetical protein